MKITIIASISIWLISPIIAWLSGYNFDTRHGGVALGFTFTILSSLVPFYFHALLKD
jgi:outer membrane phospholipase A